MTKKFQNLIDENLDPTHFVEPNYPQQQPEQMNIYLMIDLEESPPTVYVETHNFQIGGTPEDIWHNRRLCYGLPFNFDASQAHEWIETDLADDLNALIEDTEIEWNGNNSVGMMGDVAKAINDHWDHFDGLLGDAPTFDGGGLYTPIDFFSDATTFPDSDAPQARIRSGNDTHTITSETTDDEIMKIAQDLEQYSELDNVVFIGTIEGFLTDLRDDCESWGE